MNDAFVIETRSDVAAGIAVRDEKSFRFFAAEQRFAALEGARYRNLRALRLALDQLEPRPGAPRRPAVNGAAWIAPA